ncbi:MAG TPA: ABC transporter permease [Patescibacteria group bacterium]|nr:ABC transporter permease [Patescibacteria group bacterium]
MHRLRRLRLLIVKDLRRKARAPLGLIVVLAFPLLFAGMIGLVFGSKGESIPKVRLLVENLDGDTFLSRGLVSALTSTQMADYFDVKVVHDEGAALMEKGEASALLVVPRGFSSDLLAGRPLSLALVRNPAEGILPEIAEQSARMLVEVLDGGARVLRGPLDDLRPFIGENRPVITDESVAAISVAVHHAFDGASTFLTPPVITLADAFVTRAPDETGKKNADSVSNIFLFVLPGVAVYALFLVGDQGMRDLLTEAAAGTLRRQMAGPVDAGAIVVAKAAFTAILAAIAAVLLALVGALAGGAGVSVVGFVLLSLALIVAVTGASAAIYGLARNERQGATLASLVYLILGFAGGSFIPLQNLPPSVRVFSTISPFYWATQGYRLLLTSDAGAAAILPNAGVLAAIGVVLLAVGARGLGRAVRRGAGA